MITVKKTGGQVDLNLVPLTGADGAAANKTLVDDLNLSGSINLSAGAAAGYTAKGTASGGSLQGTLTDRSGVVRVNKVVPRQPARRGAPVCR